MPFILLVAVILAVAILEVITQNEEEDK